MITVRERLRITTTNAFSARWLVPRLEAHDVRLAGKLLSRLKLGSMLFADRDYDADWISELAMKKGAWANIPPKSNRSARFSPHLYRARNRIARFFNKIKQCHRVATRYDRLAANYLLSFNSCQSGYGCALMCPRPVAGTHAYEQSGAEQSGTTRHRRECPISEVEAWSNALVEQQSSRRFWKLRDPRAMPDSLNHRIAVIAGATRGIGRASLTCSLASGVLQAPSI